MRDFSPVPQFLKETNILKLKKIVWVGVDACYLLVHTCTRLYIVFQYTGLKFRGGGREVNV